ncbi:response regulator [Panacibacter sp. DH6]|uniref:Response regulator n=1 Tax=Panacibacter microcysteis TaxID=2793269 RepID=A0A931E7V4_9BACT|nr:response regulator [Panacibacter microcysteis]MBG9376880.1 response regulator [Panacibacter microcysteis]
MKKRIHVIEDDNVMLLVLESLLIKNNYEVIKDFNGKNILVDKKPYPDLYIIDINLIGKDGCEFCSLIKEENSNIPVILISANSKLQQKAKDCSADMFITKPFDPPALLTAISECLAG